MTIRWLNPLFSRIGVHPFSLGWAHTMHEQNASAKNKRFLVFFTNIFSMMQFNPMEMSNQIKQNSGYIQGLRPGKQTTQYLMSLYSNLNTADCAFLIIVSIIPLLFHYLPSLDSIAFSGIGVLLVGGGFIEIKTLLDNALKAEEEKAKQVGKEKKNRGYNK